MRKRPALKATDRRRNTSATSKVKRNNRRRFDADGAGPPLANLFNDRRNRNGEGRRYS